MHKESILRMALALCRGFPAFPKVHAPLQIPIILMPIQPLDFVAVALLPLGDSATSWRLEKSLTVYLPGIDWTGRQTVFVGNGVSEYT